MWSPSVTACASARGATCFGLCRCGTGQAGLACLTVIPASMAGGPIIHAGERHRFPAQPFADTRAEGAPAPDGARARGREPDLAHRLKGSDRGKPRGIDTWSSARLTVVGGREPNTSEKPLPSHLSGK